MFDIPATGFKSALALYGSAGSGIVKLESTTFPAGRINLPVESSTSVVSK